jgi:5'-deoxynucleotidase YfbR-like HD superfamily hydrolase
MQNYILTYTKTKFYPIEPNKEDIYIEDIAHSLSQMARANGHFKHFYSVAQHCVNCCREAKERGYTERVQLGCLLHDASESYLADITRPVKKYLTEYLTFEDRLQKIVYDKFGIGDVSEEELKQIKEVDDAMLFYEFRELMEVDLFETVPHIAIAHDFSQRDFESVEKEFIELVKALSIN